MKVEKVNIKELWFTEQLLYWNDIKDNKIKELEEENRKLKESLDIATKCSSKEEDWIIRLSEENKKLKDKLYIWKLTARDYARLQWVNLPELSNI